MRELAYLNAGIKITLTDLRVKEEDGSYKQEVFYSVEGLKEFVRYIDSSREHLVNDVIYINTEKQGTPVEVAIMYNTSYNENIHSYVNNINTIEGGTHLAGFRRALTRTLKKYAEDNKMLEKAKVEISGDDFREGLTAVISIKVAEPQFEGQTKTKLGNNEVMGAVDQAVGEALSYYPGRASQRGQNDCRQGDIGSTGTRGCTQGARVRTTQVTDVRWRHAGQTGRLLQQRPGRMRIVPCRG